MSVMLTTQPVNAWTVTALYISVCPVTLGRLWCGDTFSQYTYTLITALCRIIMVSK